MRRGKLQPALPRPVHPGSRGRHLPGGVTFVCASAGLPFARGLATGIGDPLACAGMEFPGMAGLGATKEAFVHAGANLPSGTVHGKMFARASMKFPSMAGLGATKQSVRLRRHKSSVEISSRESGRSHSPVRACSSRLRLPVGKINVTFACVGANRPSGSVHKKVAALIRPCGRGVPGSIRR